MRFVIAIFGLLGTLSAQIVCRPVGSKGDVDPSFNSRQIRGIDSDLSSRIQLFANYHSHPVRCFEHLHGTFGLGDGKVVHSLWVEVRPYEQWMSDSSFCSPSRTGEPLFRFSVGILEKPGQEFAEQLITDL
jgi:hypothetical protein